jgi:hypothetical protein
MGERLAVGLTRKRATDDDPQFGRKHILYQKYQKKENLTPALGAVVHEVFLKNGAFQSILFAPKDHRWSIRPILF